MPPAASASSSRSHAIVCVIAAIALRFINLDLLLPGTCRNGRGPVLRNRTASAVVRIACRARQRQGTGDRPGPRRGTPLRASPSDAGPPPSVPHSPERWASACICAGSNPRCIPSGPEDGRRRTTYGHVHGGGRNARMAGLRPGPALRDGRAPSSVRSCARRRAVGPGWLPSAPSCRLLSFW